MQACASIPHSIACLGFPRVCSSFSTPSIIIVKEVFAWAFRSSAPSSGTVGPKPLGYCSVKMEGMPKTRLAWGKTGKMKPNMLIWVCGCDVAENTVGGNTANLEQSCSIADDVGELKDVGSELLLHVTQEQHCVFGGEPADGRHCRSKHRQQKTHILSRKILTVLLRHPGSSVYEENKILNIKTALRPCTIYTWILSRFAILWLTVDIWTRVTVAKYSLIKTLTAWLCSLRKNHFIRHDWLHWLRSNTCINKEAFRIKLTHCCCLICGWQFKNTAESSTSDFKNYVQAMWRRLCKGRPM